MYIIMNGKNGRLYLVNNEIQKKLYGIEGKALGWVKLPSSLTAKRIFIIDEQIKMLNEERACFKNRITHLRLKIENNVRDLNLLKKIKKRVGEALIPSTQSVKGSK